MDLDYTGLEQGRSLALIKVRFEAATSMSVSLFLLLSALVLQLVPCNSGLFCMGCILRNITESD